MKNILLLVHDDAGQEARLQAALDITRAVQGHLICLDVVRLPAMAGDYFGDSVDVLLIQDERARESEHQARIDQRLAREDVAWEMRQATGDFETCLTAEAGLADLIVLNRKLDDPNEPVMQATTSAVAIKSGKPVVAVGESGGFDAAGRAVVAWDGSAPAMAALTQAVPLLAIASEVLLVEIQVGEQGLPIAEAAAYLSRHGVHATVETVTAEDLDGAGHIRIAQEILQVCHARRAAYCVMGAYGHSPLREAIFGGVTRSLLASINIPLVLAH